MYPMNNKGTDYYIQAGKRAMEWHQRHIAEMRKCRFDTIAVHGIYSMQEALDFNQGSIIEPVYMSTSQHFRDADEMEAALSYQTPTWCYSRIANPSMYYYEGVLALLESYNSGVEATCAATSSGMSAIQSAVDPFLITHPEEPHGTMNFVAPCQVYGGTFQHFSIRKEQERNIQWRKVINPAHVDEWAALIDENTRFLYGEIPTNPGQDFFDIAAVADVAHAHNLPLIIDSTVATPALLRPLALGADIVVQSVTKTLFSSGFGIAGAVIARKNLCTTIDNDQLKEDFCGYLKLLPNRDNGPNISPMTAVLALNDIRTLRSKIDLMSRSTQKIAEFLAGHKHIEQVNYLGLPSNPLHQLARKDMVLVDSEYDDVYQPAGSLPAGTRPAGDRPAGGGPGTPVNRYGHLMSFTVKGAVQNTRNVFDAFRRIWRATDLGRIKSVATIPAISTHQQQGEEGRQLAGIPANLIRLCVGGEHPDDIIADLSQALDVLDGKKWSVDYPDFSAGGASSAKLGS